ncbi:MAG: ATP-binding cassette domain-containing protein [Chloroflexota bacterium]
MSEAQIIVRDLSKTFRVPVRAAGLKAALRSLVRPAFEEVPAVQGVSFEIQAGEVVGLLGPNGAGKTTILKLLSGLLHPSRGQARVAGFVPWERQMAYLRRISMVLGNKSQMLWDIPPLDTFRVLGEIYGLSAQDYRRNLDELVELLDMSELLERPVRNLSLGERMKCELVAGLLYQPQVLFLDEPTLGLDVSMQARLRRFLLEYNRRRGVTIILTSHYMADVVALCRRVILIHHGKLLYDGVLEGLARQLAPFKLLRLALRNGSTAGEVDLPLGEGVDLIECQDGQVTLRVGREAAPALTARLLESLPVADLSVEDPPIEAVMDQIYQGGSHVTPRNLA